MNEPKRSAIVLGVLIAAMLGGAVGAGITEQLDAREAVAVAGVVRADRLREREVWTAERAKLNGIIESERRDHDARIRSKDAHLAAFTSESIRVRDTLRALLDRARADGGACAGRAAQIAEEVERLAGLLERGAGLVERGESRVRELEADNRQLADQIAGLVEQYKLEHPEQVTVTGERAP